MTIDSTPIDSTLDAALEEFKGSGQIVIVGASLAGLRAAETLREEGFRGRLTIIGDEPYEPYDRPPLSKQVLKGGVPADHTKLPRRRAIEADWRLGVAATGLDRSTKQVRLANGEQVRYDLLLIATGVRARPWFNPAEAALDGVFIVALGGNALLRRGEPLEAESRAPVARDRGRVGPVPCRDPHRRCPRVRDGFPAERGTALAFSRKRARLA
jgi:3-phenylpropionate/trans-cinnamate dioxygenase ferredoxin reductase subunit